MKIPQSWSDLNINQFIELRAALEMRDVEALDRNVLIVSALLNKSVEWVEEHLRLQDLTEIIAQCKFTAQLPSEKPIKYFWLNGTLWKCDLHVNKILPAQYIDLSLITKSEDEIIDNLHKIMAIFCRPIWQGKYNSDKANKHAEVFYKKMNSEVAYSLAVFFCNLYTELYNATQTYLVGEALKNLKEVNQNQSA